MSVWEWFKKHKSQKKPDSLLIPHQALEQYKAQYINGDMKDTIHLVAGLLGENDDFISRHFQIFGRFSAVSFYFSDLVDTASVNTEVLKPLMYLPHHLEGKDIHTDQLKELIMNEILYFGKGQLESEVTGIVEAILVGATVIVIEGIHEAFVIDTRHIEKRSIEQPKTEQLIRGAREGFIEQLATNLGLLRYRLPTPDLRIKMMKIGRITKTKVAVCHLAGIANPALVEEVNTRLSKIDIDAILDSGYLEQFIADNDLTPFPLLQNTERPDKAVGALLEGRVAILSDGSPFALLAPSVFSGFYQVMDDYTERAILASFIRLARLVALVFSLIFPSIYVSVISFNPELIPTEFAVAVAGGRSGVPFPSVVEVLLMEISMEVLREATIRLPQQVGGALSIVGVLVIGQAAVSAGFSSPITVVVIALTTIGSFATPAYNAALALRLLRFPLIILAGIFGLYGVMVGLILITNHMLSLKSFGVPYLSPVVPGNFQGMKDTLVRAPFWWMRKRPAAFHPPNEKRLGHESVDLMKHEQSNTLDPLKVGNERWNE